MKTTKEFPATHSMSTSWFVADEDGNIALFDFDENGPVPDNIPEQNASYLMTAENDFGERDNDSIEYLELTDEQVEELMTDSVTPDNYNIEDNYDLFVQVDESNKKQFLDVFNDKIEFCLSHKHGIYFVWCIYDEDESEFHRNRQKETFLKTVKRVVHIWIDSYSEDDFNGDKENWNLPFYCYKQPYSPYSDLAKRTNVPKFPFKEEQIAEKQRHKLIRIPVKLSECTGFQIAQYLICNWYSGVDEIEIDNRIYTKFPKTEGGFGYILREQNKEKDGETPIIIDAED